MTRFPKPPERARTAAILFFTHKKSLNPGVLAPAHIRGRRHDVKNVSAEARAAICGCRRGIGGSGFRGVAGDGNRARKTIALGCSGNACGWRHAVPPRLVLLSLALLAPPRTRVACSAPRRAALAPRGPPRQAHRSRKSRGAGSGHSSGALCRRAGLRAQCPAPT
ncbi:hypothetical protein D9M70_513820 [compost metagenome]